MTGEEGYGGPAEIRTRVTSTPSWKDAKLPHGPVGWDEKAESLDNPFECDARLFAEVSGLEEPPPDLLGLEPEEGQEWNEHDQQEHGWTPGPLELDDPP